MRIDVVTLFPQMLEDMLAYGVLSRARKQQVVDIRTIDPRLFTEDRHKTVDDRPYGGGEGMVMKPEPVFAAVLSLGVAPKTVRDPTREQVVMMSPQGRPLSQGMAREFAHLERLVLLCGRYEGIDNRVVEGLCDAEVSIGDYVLSGGELAAAVLIDVTVRLLPGALGNPDSAHYESFGPEDHARQERVTPRATHGSGGLLDYPQYTRPPIFAGMAVPEVLLSGDHSEIRRWRRRMSLRKTLIQRPELLEQAVLSREEKMVVEELRNDLQSHHTTRPDRG